jgi:glyoxylase-like metal-dependent hydrolase (beta-lactamase superfamily II)
MLTDFHGVGEWGFAALVEIDGRRLLFDTGARPQTVLDNARELGIDLSGVTDVVLSHHHWDHTGGLLALREALSKKNPAALSRAHVGEGIHLLGAHCTGIEAVFRLRQQACLTRKAAVVGAIGSSFSLEGGIDPLALAR